MNAKVLDALLIGILFLNMTSCGNQLEVQSRLVNNGGLGGGLAVVASDPALYPSKTLTFQVTGAESTATFQWNHKLDGVAACQENAGSTSVAYLVTCAKTGHLEINVTVTTSDHLNKTAAFAAEVVNAPINSNVDFEIAAGTGTKPWNTEDMTIHLYLGQTLRIKNNDSVLHRLHTNGSPCPHMPADIAPGQFGTCYATAEYTPPAANATADVYEHNVGPAARVWMKAERAPQDGATLYSINCQSCHGPLATSTRRGASKADIDAAIINQVPMKGLTFLTPDERQLISNALK